MTLEERINQDLKEAMKAKNQVALRGVRAIKAAILLAKTDGSGKELNTEREVAMLQKMVKQRKESIDIFQKEGRNDLLQKEQEEVEIIEKYLPDQMNEMELEALVKEVISSVGATTARDLGKVMAPALQKAAGRADGKMVSAIAKRLLEG